MGVGDTRSKATNNNYNKNNQALDVKDVANASTTASMTVMMLRDGN